VVERERWDRFTRVSEFFEFSFANFLLASSTDHQVPAQKSALFGMRCRPRLVLFRFRDHLEDADAKNENFAIVEMSAEEILANTRASTLSPSSRPEPDLTARIDVYSAFDQLLDLASQEALAKRQVAQLEVVDGQAPTSL